MTQLRILITDDQPDVLAALRMLLKSEGFACVTCSSPGEGIEAVRRERFDAALIDLNYTRDTTSGQEGLELLAQLRKLEPEMPVVVMTAWGTIDIAVQAMRAGAGDFIEKPWDNRRLVSVLRTQVELGRSREREKKLETENSLLRGKDDETFIADAPSMKPVLEMLRRVAPSDANVLILGENGTGKGVIARHLHKLSKRADKSLIKVNMGGIVETVFESEMFGHTKGAFTDAKSDRIGRFELADGGTLFLDEIANIPPSQQPKLLRVLEDGEFERVGSSRTQKVDVRLVSATNADLAVDVARGLFRKDLLFRLNTVELRLPPLRERREDIAPMARAFLRSCGRRYQREDMTLAPAAISALERYPWPGNVRELAHVIERAVLMAVSSRIEQFEFSLQPFEAMPVEHAAGGASGYGAMAPGTAAHGAGAAQTIEQAEQAMVRNALDQCGGNIQKAAEMLGLSRAALYRRLEKFGIET